MAERNRILSAIKTYKEPGRLFFTVAQVVKRLFGHVKRAPVEGPSPFLSKDNTLTNEMQIALFSPLPPKASSGEGEFSIGLPEDAAGRRACLAPCTNVSVCFMFVALSGWSSYERRFILVFVIRHGRWVFTGAPQF